MSAIPQFLRYNVLRPWLWRWHRRAGLAAAAILILVTITGILLNHTSQLSLARHYVDQSWLMSFYGIPEPTLVSFAQGDNTLTGDDKSQLYWGEQPLASCRGELVGVATYDAGFIAACQQELLFFDKQSSLVEKIGATYGLPTPVEQLGLCDGLPCIRTSKRVFALDVEQLSFKPLVGVSSLWSEPVELTASSRQAIYSASRGAGLSWERVLLDLHSGRLFGAAGVWVVDIAAVLLMFLAMSGFVLWYQHMRVKRARNAAAPSHDKR